MIPSLAEPARFLAGLAVSSLPISPTRAKKCQLPGRLRLRLTPPDARSI